ncbi:MAG TPA: zf-TFIIB domain-containing protein [Pyrinomonadaceae bacterium]|jgi:Zn-finger nucleic acid-binding protein
MNCPVCKSTELARTDAETNLPAHDCPQCGGRWLRGREYWQWLGKHGPNLPERTYLDAPPVADADEVAKACPECGFPMFRFKVGHGLAFGLDQCPGCKGIWFDRDEWAELKRRNLHDDINAVLTAPWQAQVTRAERVHRLRQVYERKFGAADYEEIKRVRAWLDAHPRKHELLAYLTDPDPYGL